MNEEYTCKTFSLSLPHGTGQSSVPGLLEHLAAEIRGRKIEILDIVFATDTDDDGVDWPYFTVYYSDIGSSDGEGELT